MKNVRRYYFLIFFLCAVFFQTRISAQTAVPDASPPPPPNDSKNITTDDTSANKPEFIHFGDLIDVDVIGSTEYDWRGTLNPEGFLSGINFTQNPIYALCQTENDIAANIARDYGKFLRAPSVVVKILDRSSRAAATLYGAVKKNQRFQIKRPVRLSELIIIAGGFTDRASGTIQILRAPNLNCAGEIAKRETAAVQMTEKTAQTSGETQYINVEINDLLTGKNEANPQILSGDIVTVLESKPIYVVGAVGTPKQIAVRAQLITLSRAVDSAGGLIKGADASSITIFRRAGVGGVSKVIEADLEKIKAGAAEDVVLQAFDVVEVAQTGREKRKFSPVFNIIDRAADERRSARNLPLRIID